MRVVEGAATSPVLRNMAWWDQASYSDLRQWVPTLGRLPKSILHDLGLLRGAVCEELRCAHLANDAVGRARAEKLLTYMDRLLLHSTDMRGGKKLCRVLSARLRLAWAGDWGALWREAIGTAQARRGRSRRRRL